MFVVSTVTDKKARVSQRGLFYLKRIRELFDARLLQQLGHLPGFSLGQRTAFFDHHRIARLELIVRRMRMIFL